MFVRLTVNELHQESKQSLGILHAVRYLRDDGKLTKQQEKTANEVFDWLFNHLPAPRKKLLKTHPKAVSWFRITAKKHVSWARRLIPIVSAHGYKVTIKKSYHPGTIVYQDDIQVLAIRKRRLTKTRNTA